MNKAGQHTSVQLRITDTANWSPYPYPIRRDTGIRADTPRYASCTAAAGSQPPLHAQEAAGPLHVFCLRQAVRDFEACATAARKVLQPRFQS